VLEVSGSPDGGFVVKANDGIESELDCTTLTVGADNVLYCTVDRGGRGTFEARFLRSAYYEIARWIDDGSGRAALVCKGTRHPLGRRADVNAARS
jgi:hypothetical protein